MAPALTAGRGFAAVRVPMTVAQGGWHQPAGLRRVGVTITSTPKDGQQQHLQSGRTYSRSRSHSMKIVHVDETVSELVLVLSIGPALAPGNLHRWQRQCDVKVQLHRAAWRCG